MLEDGFEIIELAIGALDQPNDIGPLQHQVGVESRLTWFSTMHLLAERTTSEDRSPEDLAKLRSLQHPDHD